jgi:cell division protease FtsH
MRDYSEAVAGVIDDEVRTLIENAHMEAYEILVENRDVLDRLVLELMERETLDQAEVAEIFHDVRKRPMRPKWTGSPNRMPQAGPVTYVRADVSALAGGAAANGSANGSANGANGHAASNGHASPVDGAGSETPVQDADAGASQHDDPAGAPPGGA